MINKAFNYFSKVTDKNLLPAVFPVPLYVMFTNAIVEAMNAQTCHFAVLIFSGFWWYWSEIMDLNSFVSRKWHPAMTNQWCFLQSGSSSTLGWSRHAWATAQTFGIRTYSAALGSNFTCTLSISVNGSTSVLNGSVVQCTVPSCEVIWLVQASTRVCTTMSLRCGSFPVRKNFTPN